MLLVGMAVAIVGYALLYNGMANLGSARFGGGPSGPSIGFSQSLVGGLTTGKHFAATPTATGRPMTRTGV